MWESLSAPSRPRFLTRSILSCAVAALVAAFLWVLLVTSPVFAVDASWSGSDISYNSRTYSKETADGTNPPDLPNGSTYYLATDPSTAYVIYFNQGANPQTAETAQHATYRLEGDELVKQSGPTQITLTSQAKSASSTRAAWNGNSLTFDGRTFTGDQTKANIADGTTPRGLASGTQYYEFIGNDSGNGTAKAAIIYFPAGTDPRTATAATYQEYEVSSDGLGATIGSSKQIDVTTAAESPSGSGANAGLGDGSSCAINGIGWIVCPISNFLAWGMDHVFEMLKSYLTVKTIANDTQGGVFRAWSFVRNIANIAFIISFMVIIYSQITGIGVSNYGIKKILPRLVVAAVLVNVSYWICAVAVDLSNIFGSSLQSMLIGIRETLRSPNTQAVLDWQSVSGFLLAGGTATAAAAVGLTIFVTTVGASAGAAVILLLPMLLGLMLAVLVALLVLAARQALIIVFVIVAPLAFVAYILPNTEKLFDKWRSTFMTLLVFFPLFALIFGGSQLAGFLIMDNTNDINVALLGMFVQVAPLVITPLLVRFSGNIIGRVANMVNNPNKGFVDRTRKWAQDRSSLMAAKNMARTDPVRQRQVFRRLALDQDERRRKREGMRRVYDTQNDARWANSQAFSDIDVQSRAAQDLKTFGETNAETRYMASKSLSREMRNLDINVRDAKLKLENAKLDSEIQWERNHDPLIAEQRLRARVANDTIATLKAEHDAAYEEFKAGNNTSYPTTSFVASLAHQNRMDTQQMALEGMRKANAQRVQQNNLTNTLAKAIDQSATAAERAHAQNLLDIAGGIQGQKGAQRALAQALTDQHKARAETIANASAIIEHSNLSAEETLRIAQNISTKGITVTDDLREAAAKRVAGGGVIPHIEELLKSIDMTATGDEHLRVSIVEALRGNSARPKFIGFGLMDKMTQGLPGPVDDVMIDGWIQSMLVEGKLSTNELVSQDKDTLARISDALTRLPRTPQVTGALANLKRQIKNVNDNAQMRDRAGERMQIIDDMDKKI